jgi:hypothetical protein
MHINITVAFGNNVFILFVLGKFDGVNLHSMRV